MPTLDHEHKPNRRFLLLILLLLAAALLFVVGYRMFLKTGETPAQLSTAQPAASSVPIPQRDGSEKIAGTQALLNAPGQPAPFTNTGSSEQASAIGFKGVVLNAANRAGIEGAKVRVYAYAAPSAIVEKTTGANGTFQVEAPPGFRYGVKVEAEGFRPYSDDSLSITRPSYEMQILLTPTMALRGRVVDQQSAGIPEALVTLRRENDRSPSGLSAPADAQGAFVFMDVPRDGRYWVEAYHPAYDTMGMVTVTIPAQGEVMVRMRPARASGALAGTVTDSARRPVAGARIALFDAADGRPLSRTQSDRQGMYRFARMREGYYVVRCSADGFAESRSHQGAAAIYSGKEARLDFSLEAGLQIRGIVVSQKGDPVLQALVVYATEDGPRSGPPQVIATDPEGRFLISGLRDTQYLLTVSHRDFLDLAVRVRPSGQLQTLVLDPGLTLRGTVSDERGAAVERFALTFLSASSRYSKSCPLTTTDGRFEIRGLPRDSYLLRLQAGNSSYAGPLDLQASTEIFISLDAPSGKRGMIPLNILKAR